MNANFSKICSQVALSYLLQGKWCIEYTSKHYNKYTLCDICLVKDSNIMIPRHEIVRFFRVVPDAATGNTIREVVSAYAVNSSKNTNSIHLELVYTEDKEYDMELDKFISKNNPASMQIFPKHIVEAFRVLGLKEMEKHCNMLFESGKIKEFRYTVKVDDFNKGKTNTRAFSYDMEEKLY